MDKRGLYIAELQKAAREGYAVGAFNILNFNTASAAIAAAEEAGAPIILQTSVKTVQKLGVRELGKMLRMLADMAGVNVFFHLDHCASVELAKQCIDSGWDSVMIDNSKLSLEENIRITNVIMEYARAANVAVEGELGVIAGVEDDISADEGRQANLKDSLQYIRATNVDTFAPSIGTAHGIYKKTPKINAGLISELKSSVQCPLVIHGGSGLSDDTFRALIQKGASKINISTAIKNAYLGGIREYFQNAAQPESLELDAFVFDNVKETVKKHIGIFRGQKR